MSWAVETDDDVRELVDLALDGGDSEEAWEAVQQLRKRANSEMLRLSARLVSSDQPAARELGANILAQLGWPEWGQKREFAFQSEALAMLRPLLRDREDGVVMAAVYALGHRRDQESTTPIIQLSDHPSEDVRLAVACALPGLRANPEALAALIRLSGDVDADVRDWATFGLGSQTDADSEYIREALVARLDDEVEDVRFEAVVGLARRTDGRVFPRLSEFFETENLATLREQLRDHLDHQLVPLLEAYSRFESDSEGTSS